MSTKTQAPNLRENKMGTMPIGKLLLNMALPMIMSMLVQALYNVVDSIYISRYSESAVTALGLAFPSRMSRSASPWASAWVSTHC